MGASGSGKSTFMHLLAGLDSPTSGTITCLDTSSFVTQSPFFIKELTVFENIALAGQIKKIPKKELCKKIDYLLDAVGLLETKKWQVGALSGGQQQRIALVRALVTEPTFLLADELTGNLDTTTGKIIMDLLLDFQKKYNMGLILSTHNEKIAERMQVVLEIEKGLLTRKENKYERSL